MPITSWLEIWIVVQTGKSTSLRLRQDDRHLQDIFKYIFLNENVQISIKVLGTND